MKSEITMMVVSMLFWAFIFIVGVLIGVHNPLGYLLMTVGGMMCLMGITYTVVTFLGWLLEKIFKPKW